jgi:outer membrane biosynthesis protein TonB
MKKPTPLYASKPRFGLGSLVALVFVAAFAIAAIVFGLNTLNNTPASPQPQPVFTLEITPTQDALPTDAPIETAPVIAVTEAPTLAPATAPILEPTLAPTASPAATATAAPTAAPSPTPAAQPSATPRATATAAPSPTPAATATAAPLSTGETVSYTVKGGDTCGKIARELGVTVAQIIEWNNLDERCFLNVNKVLTIRQ